MVCRSSICNVYNTEKILLTLHNVSRQQTQLLWTDLSLIPQNLNFNHVKKNVPMIVMDFTRLTRLLSRGVFAQTYFISTLNYSWNVIYCCYRCIWKLQDTEWAFHLYSVCQRKGNPTSACSRALDTVFIEKCLHNMKIQAFSCSMIPFLYHYKKKWQNTNRTKSLVEIAFFHRWEFGEKLLKVNPIWMNFNVKSPNVLSLLF